MAKVLMFYFSQNGSTKFLVDFIKNKFKENSIITKSIDITTNKEDVDTYDYKIIIFCSPIYYKREPLIWKSFIGKLENLNGKAGYVFSTRGLELKEDEPLIVENFREMTFDKGLKIIGDISTLCENSYPPFKIENMNKGRPNLSDIQKVDKYVDGIIEKIKYRNIDRAIYDVTYKPNKTMLKKMNAKLLFSYSPKIKLIESSCTLCKLCVEPCPIDNIKVEDKLIFGDNCMKCYKCYSCCPNNAFEVNWDKVSNFLQKINIS